MQIKAAKVLYFYPEAEREPLIHLLVDAIPLHGFVFEEREHIYRAEREGVVRYFYYAGPRGSGEHFNVEMKDGSLRKVEGSWDVESGLVNQYFDHCVDVLLSDSEQAFSHDSGYFGSVTVEVATRALEKANSNDGLSRRGLFFHLMLRHDEDNGLIDYTPILAMESPTKLAQVVMSRKLLELSEKRELPYQVASSLAIIGHDLFRMLPELSSILPKEHVSRLKTYVRQINKLVHLLSSPPRTEPGTENVPVPEVLPKHELTAFRSQYEARPSQAPMPTSPEETDMPMSFLGDELEEEGDIPDFLEDEEDE